MFCILAMTPDNGFKNIVMKKFGIACICGLVIFLSSCHTSKKSSTAKANEPSTNTGGTRKKTFVEPLDVDRGEFVKYAKKFLGTPYKYGSSDPSKGLDCSGFIYHVFNNFNIKAPRVTRDFTNEGVTVDVNKARVGDIILFTGSNHSSGIVGHMGIITQVKPSIQFVHSASGKNIGVIINSLNGYYKTHFVKVISVFK